MHSRGDAVCEGFSAPRGEELRLLNHRAERGRGATNDRQKVPLPDWLTTGGFTAVQYGRPGGFPDAVNQRNGKNFFAGGPGSSAVSTARQTVTVRSRAAAIDGGNVRVRLSALIGGLLDRPDSGVIEAVFLDSQGGTLGRLRIGPVDANDRHKRTGLIYRKCGGDVPAGTRSIRVVMTASRVSGSYNDAYFDNVGLTIFE